MRDDGNVGPVTHVTVRFADVDSKLGLAAPGHEPSRLEHANVLRDRARRSDDRHRARTRSPLATRP
jgi:hypothetical protein